MSGLFSAAFLRQIGWDADVYERSPVELVGRGAGITTHPELLEALEQSGAGTQRPWHRSGKAHRHRPAGPHHRRAAVAANPDLVGPPAAAAARDHRPGALPSRLGVRACRAERQRRARAFQRRSHRGGRYPGRRRRCPLERARPGRAGIAADLRRLLHLARLAERGRPRAEDAEGNLPLFRVLSAAAAGGHHLSDCRASTTTCAPATAATISSGIAWPTPRSCAR